MDNLPNTVMEALACGTPAAAFGVGGIPEMIEHQETGWLATPGDAAGLADGLDWLLSDPARLAGLRRAARASAQRKYDTRQQARACLDLYQELLAVDERG
ncbi:MAG: glycosyltransferase [Anaerolineales bacterium]|nr:glycosyltransferase [Anaerolineales bacterium]